MCSLSELRAERPGLAEAVETEAIKLDEAIRTAAADAEQRKSQRWAFARNLIDGVRGLESDVEQSQDQANGMMSGALALDADAECTRIGAVRHLHLSNKVNLPRNDTRDIRDPLKRWDYRIASMTSLMTNSAMSFNPSESRRSQNVNIYLIGKL
jgi:hypothetical protein